MVTNSLLKTPAKKGEREKVYLGYFRPQLIKMDFFSIWSSENFLFYCGSSSSSSSSM